MTLSSHLWMKATAIVPFWSLTRLLVEAGMIHFLVVISCFYRSNPVALPSVLALTVSSYIATAIDLVQSLTQLLVVVRMVRFLVAMLMLLSLPPQSSLGDPDGVDNVVIPLDGGHGERPVNAST